MTAIATRRVRRSFGHADEHPYRRLVADWVKLALAAVLLVASVRHVAAETASERELGGFLTSLPAGAGGIFRAVLAFGTLWGVGLVVAAALLARRWRLALVLAVAGAAGWGVARFASFLAQDRSVGSALRATFDGTAAGRYPVTHLAVLGAVVLAASPFLGRPARRLGRLLLVLLAAGALYRSTGTPNDVLGALVAAWGVAAAVHLGFGSPAGRPTAAQAAVALEQLGLRVTGVRLAPNQATGFTRMLADTTNGGTLPVRVYGRDAADTRLLAKAWRFLAFKESGPTLTLTRLQQVEHEALCLLMARDAGVVVPEVVAVGEAGPSAALLVTRMPPHSPLLGDDPALDEQLATLWNEVLEMHVAHVAHGALDLDHVGVHDRAVLVTDFSAASVSAPANRLARDVGQLLFATATIAGEGTATRIAVASLGPETVADALPYLQRPALTRANRRAARHDKELLDRLRDAIVAQTGREPAKPIELRRVKPFNIVMFAGFALAIWVILGQIGSVGDLVDTLKTASIPWALTGFVLAQCTAVAFAIVTVGSVPDHIALASATALQMAISFANMVAATGVSSTVMNIRFLQKQGVDVGAATSSGVLAGVSGTIAQFGLFIVSGLVVGEEIRLGQIGGVDRDRGRLILAIVVIAAIIVGITLSIPKIRRAVREKVWPQIVGALRNVWGILTTPRQLACVLGGSIAAQLLYSLCLLCCVLAYGGSLTFLEVVFVNTSASFLASLTPVPGGMGITEATMIAGLGAFGVTPEIAAAAVVTHRLFTSYLPPIWGSYAAKRLVAAGYL